MAPRLSPDPPAVRDPRSARVLVTTWQAPDRVPAEQSLEATARAWVERPWPAELLTVSWFIDVDGCRLLTWVQCLEATAAIHALTRSVEGAGRAGPMEYRPTRQVVLRDESPACIVVATFDVDGANAQDRITNGILSAFETDRSSAPPGMLAANFYASADGSRVLNYAEWASDEDHEAFLSGAGRRTTQQITHDTAGVRPIGFTRFHLYRSSSVADTQFPPGRQDTRRTTV